MLNETIISGLKPYAIGEKLRKLRLRKSMGLVQLGQHTGLSPAMLSKLETGKLVPTVPTLLRIAMVFSVGLDYFFTDESKRHPVFVMRRGERTQFPERMDGAYVQYMFESLDYKANDRRTNAFLAEFPSLGEGQVAKHTHTGAEWLYVLAGTLELSIAGNAHVLEAGDAIYFDGTAEHSYRRVGEGDCRALVVTVP